MSDPLIYVAGHRGMVGAALVRRLEQSGYTRLVLRSHAEFDLTDQVAVDAFFAAEHPDWVLLAAARVGGIEANRSRPAAFIRDNLLIQTHVIDAAWRNGVQRLLFLGSSCVYPRLAAQPMTEDCLLTGPLEPTNQAYAIAKIAGIEMCRAYRRQYGFDAISLMPTNLYGPGDNFDPQDSHVIPGLIGRLHAAKRRASSTVTLWGTGTPRREFLHVDDLAAAAVLALERYRDETPLNVGTGEDLTIRELAALIADVVGFRGEIAFDPSRPDGPPRKLLDVTRVTAIGWRPRIPLRAGLERTYQWYLDHLNEVGGAPREYDPVSPKPDPSAG